MNPTLLLTHASGFLTAEARGLYVCCSQDGDWRGMPESKALYDDLHATAAGLLALASEISLNHERKHR